MLKLNDQLRYSFHRHEPALLALDVNILHADDDKVYFIIFFAIFYPCLYFFPKLNFFAEIVFFFRHHFPPQSLFFGQFSFGSSILFC